VVVDEAQQTNLERFRDENRTSIFRIFVLIGGVACLGLVAGILAAQANALTPAKPAPIGQLVDVGGYRVHVYCTGKGTPTVVIAGAFSFDWSLVQPKVAKFTRVCSFDPSGTTWSDLYPFAGEAPTCDQRVEELQSLITRTPIEGPYVFVGFSTGALWARLYAIEHPDSIKGMVIVDHAFLGSSGDPSHRASPRPHSYTPPVLISKAPFATGYEDNPNFSRLPERDQELHRWAMSQHPLKPGEAMVNDCVARIDHLTGQQVSSLEDLPLIVISTPNGAPGYAELQEKLLTLSRNSKQSIAQNSSHMVLIDRPDIVIQAIREITDDLRYQVESKAH
jgi:pimeloyl-ACP methyl ester carboxylesterase